MERKSFFKSLLTLIAAPSILKDVDFRSSTEIKRDDLLSKKAPTGQLVSDLQLLTPHYYKQYVEKYGDTEYLKQLENMPFAMTANPNIFHYTKA